MKSCRPWLQGACEGEPVAVKAYNLDIPGAANTYENEKLAYGGLEALQGHLIPRLVCSGMLGHTASPAIVTSFEGIDLAEGERVPQRLHKPMRAALHALHQAGAAHGDVRRSNFRVGDADKVWLIDLGQTVLQASKAQLDADKRRLKEMLAK